MVKRLSLVIFICLLLSGCGDGVLEASADEYNPKMDSQYYLATGKSNYAEGENGYYYMTSGGYLLYVNAQTMDVVPLCSRPECLHNDETDPKKKELCNSYFPVMPYVLYVGGYVWVFRQMPASVFWKHRYELIRMEPDGSNRKTMVSFECVHAGNPVVHRNHFFCTTFSTDENGMGTSQILSFNLNKVSSSPTVLYATEQENAGYNTFHDLLAYGSRLYWVEKNDEIRQTLKYTDLNGSGVVEWTLPEEMIRVSDISVMDGRLLVWCSGSDWVGTIQEYNGYTEHLYSCDLSGNDVELLSDDAAYCIVAADSKYIYQTTPYTGDILQDSITVYDKSMKKIDEIPFQQLTDDKIIAYELYPSQKQQMIIQTFVASQSGGEYRFFWFDKSEIGSNSIKTQEFFKYNDQDY